jgi:hypothetical protein
MEMTCVSDDWGNPLLNCGDEEYFNTQDVSQFENLNFFECSKLFTLILFVAEGK